jgi:hypothetical protein
LPGQGASEIISVCLHLAQISVYAGNRIQGLNQVK